MVTKRNILNLYPSRYERTFYDHKVMRHLDGQSHSTADISGIECMHSSSSATTNYAELFAVSFLLDICNIFLRFNVLCKTLLLLGVRIMLTILLLHPRNKSYYYFWVGVPLVHIFKCQEKVGKEEEE